MRAFSLCVGLFVAACSLALPVASHASVNSPLTARAASSGQISVSPLGADQISVSGSGTYDCASSVYCGWFPSVSEVPADQPCSNASPDYVGQITEDANAAFAYTTYPYSWGFGESVHPAIKLCLYVNYPSYQEALVAETVYAPAPTRAPTQTQTPVTAPTQTVQSPQTNVGYLPAETLTVSEAKSEIRSGLSHKFGKRFTRGRGYRAACHRQSRLRVQCRTSWRYNGKWRATVTVRADETDFYLTYSGVHRPAKPSPPPASNPSPPPSGQNFCDTHSCIPNFPNGTGYIVQCNDGMWSHSGGRPGACSGHDGVSSSTASVTTTTRTNARRLQASRNGALKRARILRAPRRS